MIGAVLQKFQNVPGWRCIKWFVQNRYIEVNCHHSRRTSESDPLPSSYGKLLAMLPMPVCPLLHHSWWYWRRRTRKALAGTRVDYRDCVSRAQGWRLENLHVMAIVWLETGDGSIMVVRGRRQRERCCDLLRGLDLLLERRGLRWAARHRPLGRCRVYWVKLWERILISRLDRMWIGIRGW